MSIKNGYTIPGTLPTDPNAKRKYDNNVEAKNIILSGLSDTISLKFKNCKSAKDIWGRLRKIYDEVPSTARSDSRRKKKKGARKCADDKIRSNSSCNKDEKATHLFMAQEI